jgi:hypothetical protein
MSPAELLVPFALAGFHIAITLFALYRARIAWIRSAVEQRADRRTLWRLAFLRFVAVIVALSGGALSMVRMDPQHDHARQPRHTLAEEPSAVGC